MKLALLLLLLLSPVAGRAQSLATDRDRVRAFADTLARRGDDARAAAEWERAMFLGSPDSLLDDIGRAHRRRGQPGLAVAAFGRLLPSDPERAATQIGYTYLLSGDDRSAERFLADHATGALGRRIRAAALLDLDETTAARPLLAPDDPLAPLLAKPIRHRSPVAAALLSAIVPGAGQVYAGRMGDGLTALAMVGGLAWLSVSSAQHDHRFRAWTFGGLAGGFYAGTVYGAIPAARLSNRAATAARRAEVLQALQRDPAVQGLGALPWRVGHAWALR